VYKYSYLLTYLLQTVQTSHSVKIGLTIMTVVVYMVGEEK